MSRQRVVRNVLVVRNDRFGEFLLIIPALRALKETFPGCRVTAAVTSQVRELVPCVPYIDACMVWENAAHAQFQPLELSRELRRSRFDAAVVFNPTKEFHAAAFLAGIPMRAGYARKWGFLLSRRISDTRHCAEKHEIDYNLELVQTLGADTRDKSLCLDVKDDIIKSMDAGLVRAGGAPVVAVHPFTSDSVKQWPYERFRDLIVELRRQCRVQVVVVGKPHAQAPQSGYWNEAIDMTGKTTLPQLAALLKGSRCLVSCDSGPVHLASCVGVPSVVLFRNDLPGKSAVRWGPVSEGSVVLERSRLADISVDAVLGKVKEIMKKGERLMSQ